MKTIGKTNEGYYLVEMSPDEHGAMARLAGAADGWGEHDSLRFGTSTISATLSLENPLNAVQSYSSSLEHLNSLIQHLDQVRASLRQN